MDRRHDVEFLLPVPVMTRERFASWTGLEEGVLRGMIDKGHLPTLKLGRRRLINLIALAQLCKAAWPVSEG